MSFDLNDGIAILERTPATLDAMLRGVPESWTTCNEGPDTFSAYDNVAHLIDGELNGWIPRARVILAQGADRSFTPYDQQPHWQSEGKPLTQLLDEFARLRAGNLATLRGWQLTDAQLALEGEHPALGTVTLSHLLATWVAHDLGHIAQISRVMAKRYREAVGPWRETLPILDR